MKEIGRQEMTRSEGGCKGANTWALIPFPARNSKEAGMKGICLFFAALVVFIPAVGCGGEYALVISKNHCLCQHLLHLYNNDIRQFGEVRYSLHKEFNWPEWKHQTISIVGVGGVSYVQDAEIALFDINNDSRNEAIVHTEPSLSNSPTDQYDIFDYGDIAILNETVDGRVYYKKVLKSFSSADGVPVNIFDLREEDLKELPEELRFTLEAAKKRGEKHISLGDAVVKINFLRLENRVFLTFEERSNAEMLAMALHRFYEEGGDPKTSRRSNQWLVDGFNELAKYSIVSEYQKDNTLSNQCLFVRKDTPAKREVK